MVIVIVPGVTLNEERGITLYEPLMLMGTTGRLNSKASLNAPFLNGCSLPLLVRRPSGNITSDVPP